MDDQPISTAKVCEIYQLKSDDSLLRFFAEAGLTPVVQVPQGRGTMRLWDRATVLRHHDQFKAWDARRRAALSAPNTDADKCASAGAKNLKGFQRNYDTIIQALNDNSTELRQINRKLDDLLEMWGSAPATEAPEANHQARLGGNGNGSQTVLGKFWRK